MTSLSRLGKQIEEVIATLNAVGAQFALIGGLALASHKVHSERSLLTQNHCRRLTSHLLPRAVFASQYIVSVSRTRSSMI